VPFHLGPGILALVVQSYTLMKQMHNKKSCNSLTNSSLRIPKVVKEIKGEERIRKDKAA
jgi:hypothetical protein